MTETDIMTRPSDTYFVVTAAHYGDTTKRWLVAGTASQSEAVTLGERQVAGMVSGFANRAEALETYPDLDPKPTGWDADPQGWVSYMRDWEEHSN